MLDRILRFCDRRPIGATVIAITIMALLWIFGLIQMVAIVFVTIFADIFSVIWNHVLPWPDCYMSSSRDGDICAAVGVIYLPLTYVLTIVIMMVGAGAVVWFLRQLAR